MGWRPRDRVVSFAPLSQAVVALAAMRLHLRIDENDASENAVIEACESAAVAAIERAIQRLLVPRQVVLRLPSLPGGRGPVELPGGDVQSLTSVEVGGSAIAGSEVLGGSPAVLVPAADWPVLEPGGWPVTITYVAGFAQVPPDLLAAVKLWAAHLFEHREAVGPAMSEIPLAVSALIAPHRIAPA